MMNNNETKREKVKQRETKKQKVEKCKNCEKEKVKSLVLVKEENLAN